MTNFYNKIKYNLKIVSFLFLVLLSIMCVPPSENSESDNKKEQEAFATFQKEISNSTYSQTFTRVLIKQF